jgi:hypothetical protein
VLKVGCWWRLDLVFFFFGEKSKPPNRQKSENLNLPKAIIRHSAKNSLILPHSASAPNLDRRINTSTPLDHLGKITPNVPPLSEENGHNSNDRAPVGDKRTHSRR